MLDLLHPSHRWRSRGLVLLATVGSIAILLALDPASRTPYPVDAEATHAMLGESLLHDGDALYGPEDLRRAYPSWAGGPRGLRLAPVDGGRGHGLAASPLYAVLTLPFRAVLGRRGPLVANGLALAAAALLIRRRLGRRSDRSGRATAVWWLAAAIGSAALVYALLPQPQALLMAAIAAAAAIWLDHRDIPDRRRAPWAAVGLLLGLAAAAQPSLAVVGIAVAADLALLRRRRALGAVSLAAVVAWLASMALWGALTGGGWGAGAVRVYAGELPFGETLVEAPAEAGGDPSRGEMEASRPRDETGRVAGSHPLSWRRLAVESWYWLCGRSGGLVVLFPGALVALLAAAWGARERPQLLLLGAAVAVAAVAVVARAAAVPGETGTLGARGFVAVFPLLLLAADRPPPKPLLGLGAVAAAVWTLPALVAVLATGAPADPSAGGPLAALRLLPAELTRFADAERFGWTAAERGGSMWVTPARLTSPAGGDGGFWLRGDARAEVWVVAPRALDEIALTARALSPHGSLELRSAGTRVTTRFDSPDKRAGTPLVVPLAPRTAGLEVFARREVFHRLTVLTGTGVPGDRAVRVGAHDGPPRYPGVLLDLDPDFRVAPRSVHESRRDSAGSG